MTNPKMKPCPKCGSAEWLEVYTYDNGWRHVECDNGFNTSPEPCLYLGPGAGSIKDAIKQHNARVISGSGSTLPEHYEQAP